MMHFRALVAVGVAGVAILVIALGIPRYSDPDWQEPFLVALPEAKPERDLFTQRWHQARDAASTHRRTLEDAGSGLILLGASLALLFAVTRSRERHLLSPRTASQWFLFSATASLFLVGGFIVDLHLGMARDDFPWWADSIGIPLMAVSPLLGLGLAGASVLAALSKWLSPSAISLASLPILSRPLWLALPLALSVALVGGLLALSTLQAPTYVPAFCLALYLALSFRVLVLRRARGLTSGCS